MIANKTEVIGNGQFFFSPNSRTLTDANANGWIKFADVANAKISPQVEAQEHTYARRGTNTRGKTSISQIGLQLMLEAHSINFASLAVLLGSGSKRGPKQEDGTNQASAACEVISVSDNNYPDIWYPIKTAGGVHLRNITTASFVAGSTLSADDYELDKRNGLVRFLRGLTPTVNVTPTCAADGFNTEAALQGDVAAKELRKEGLGRFVAFGDEGDPATGLPIPFLIWNDFSCEISIEGSTDFDPNTASNVNIQVDITDLAGQVDIQRK